ncbi:extracellular solute-binding protein [Streptomyces sp. MS19]|uniref:extracellular solute-binding protein n=1 Tax=Streptomyces sp. MS19 TaxID=3385972 RepID=UPI0039A0CBC7
MPRTTSLSRRHLLAAGTGCGAGAGGAPDLDAAEVPTGEVTLDWWSFRMATADGGDVRETLVRAFNRRHPDIRVNLVEAPANTDITRTTLSTADASGAPFPDLYMGDVAWPAQFEYNASALPLGSLLPGAFWEGFPGALVRARSFEDEPYAFPFHSDQSYLHYRADLLDKHGLAVPRTWEEVARAATAVRRAGDADAGGTVPRLHRRPGDARRPGRRAGVRLPPGRAGRRGGPGGGGDVQGAALHRRVHRRARRLPAQLGVRLGVVEGAGSPVAGRVGVMPRPGFDGGGPDGHGCLGGWCDFVTIPVGIAVLVPAFRRTALSGLTDGAVKG